MSGKPLTYVRDARSIRLAGEVRAALPKLTERSRRWKSSNICPVCGDLKDHRARRCHACYTKQRKAMARLDDRHAVIPRSTLTMGKKWSHGKTGTRPDQPPLPQMIKQPDGTWRTRPWSDGPVPSADAPPTASPSSSSTEPTARLVACRPSASAPSASSERSDPVTLTRTDWAKNNTVPPKSNEAVAQIMAERGVNRRRAYELLRAEKAAKVDTSNIGQGQRIAVLACLIANPKSGRDAAVLLDALHDAGLRIDMHDTVKTLWALQKTRYVQFRERGSRSLYAIKVTGEGVAAYERMTTPPDHRDPAHLIEAPVQEVAVLSNVLALAEDVIEQEEEIMEAPPPPPININMYEWPALYALRERALRATKVNAAIRLLEEAGEDEVALTLMGKVEFNQLEQEVVNLLKIMGENIE